MKKIRIFMLLMAVLTVVACFVACGNVETTAEITTTETPVTTLPPLTAFESLKIAGNDLSASDSGKVLDAPYLLDDQLTVGDHFIKKASAGYICYFVFYFA